VTPDKKKMSEWLKEHDACDDGYRWAMRECKSLSEVWQTAKPEWLVWVATREGVLNDQTLRLFACWSVRRVWHLLTDERSRNAVEVAERFARGQATKQELAAAMAAARAAARAAAWAAAWAASDAAWAASDAASAAAWAARDAASAAAWDAAWAAQDAESCRLIRLRCKRPALTRGGK